MVKDLDTESVLTKKQQGVLMKDVCFLIMMLNIGSFLLYANVGSLVRDLQARKRWSGFDIENELRCLDGLRLGKWQVSVRGHYLFLS